MCLLFVYVRFCNSFMFDSVIHFVSGLVRVVDFLTRAHVTGVGNGQVNCAHTGCSRQTPALHVHFARPIWLAPEGVARGLCQFIGQNKVWEGDGWVWGEGKPSPPLLWKKCGPSHPLPPCFPLDLSLQTHWRRLSIKTHRIYVMVNVL